MYPMPGENADPGTTFLLSFTIAAPADLVPATTVLDVLYLMNVGYIQACPDPGGGAGPRHMA